MENIKSMTYLNEDVFYKYVMCPGVKALARNQKDNSYKL